MKSYTDLLIEILQKVSISPETKIWCIQQEDGWEVSFSFDKKMTTFIYKEGKWYKETGMKKTYEKITLI